MLERADLKPKRTYFWSHHDCSERLLKSSTDKVMSFCKNKVLEEHCVPEHGDDTKNIA